MKTFHYSIQLFAKPFIYFLALICFTSCDDLFPVDNTNNTNNSTGGLGNSTNSKYKGPNSQQVYSLLSKAGYYDINTPPQTLCTSGACIRDYYVCAAIAYAWAADTYAKTGQPSKAIGVAESMMKELDKARALCSNTPTTGSQSCITSFIYPC